MTNEEAILWCRAHSVVVIFHKERIVMALPYHKIDVEAFREAGFKLEMRQGFALSYTEPGDDFHHVVEAAAGAWTKKLSPVDQIGEATGRSYHPVKFRFQTDM